MMDTPALGASISRLYYINAYGYEIYPGPNMEHLMACAAALCSSMRPARPGRGARACICMSSRAE
ncbi:hypothetical protein EWM64_g10034 [Hericium alpestre]|uniref:Uncharacterized protein n=1 Tax=Hericium alpestre TaxID=135208 RepID=A0A4Y9ZK05_9AGAM|nr:hypothetical protein EWM64_g10034 [Hericium alpestre]